LLALLAAVYDCAVTDLIDLADRERLPPTDLLILDKYSQSPAQPTRGNVTPSGERALAADDIGAHHIGKELQAA
jgi:hypothetical protein